MNTEDKQTEIEDLILEIKRRLEEQKDENGIRIYTQEYIDATVEKFTTMITSGKLKLTKDNI